MKTSVNPSDSAQSARRTLILAPAPVQALDLVGPAEVFAQAGRLLAASRTGTVEIASAPAPDLYSVEVVIVPLPDQAADVPTTTSGIVIAGGASLSDLLQDLRPIDTLIVGGGEGARMRASEPELVEVVRTLAGRARRVASVCTGAFILAECGLLDGRRASTHWRWCDALARTYPAVEVVADAIYTRDDNLWTSAGITAGMDMSLALVEQDFGHGLALAIARELVMFLRRPGGQAQFSATLAAQTVANAGLRDLVAWIADNLHRPLSIEVLAAHVNRSPRQFFRIFLREFGVSPAQMVDRLRVEAARSRLEETPQGLSTIAAACGFGTEETLRRAFIKNVGTSPGAYRDRFCRSVSSPDQHYVEL